MIPVPEAVQTLIAAGYDSGWAVVEEKLVLWEHDEDPPAPLTRPAPQEAADDAS